jgi:hypothetical protein
LFHFNVLQLSRTVTTLSIAIADFAFRNERRARKWTFSRELEPPA